MSRATLLLLLACFTLRAVIAGPATQPSNSSAPSPPVSTAEQALQLLEHTALPDSSAWWPNIRRSQFIANLRANILYPLKIYQGSNTNFCGYAALSYIPLHQDPLGYTRFLLSLYVDGKASYGKVRFEPSPGIHRAAGTLRFKGILDIRPADQLWFLALADRFRSYLNFFHRRFHAGSEDTFWAAVSYGKFNRMIRQLFGYTVEARGSDLIRPHIPDLYGYLTAELHRPGLTYLYVNNTFLHKKNHDKHKGNFPTHFIVLDEIRRTEGPPVPAGAPGHRDDMVDIIYWDYGGRTLRQVSLQFLKKITFGITHCLPPTQKP